MNGEECTVGTEWLDLSVALNIKNEVIMMIDGEDQQASMSLNTTEVGILSKFLSRAHACMVKNDDEGALG